MKKCPRCKIGKAESYFSKNSGRKDGLQGWCKDCIRLNSQTEKGKSIHKKGSETYWSKYPEKRKAQRVINNAIRDGRIERPSYCEGCFQEKFVEGHHPDYDKPLEVDWLCKKCHRELHKELAVL